MNQIESLRLTGFQSHENTTIRLSEGLNVIVGDTESGKSSILRAISLVLFNKPWHPQFINKDAEDCIVELRYSKDGVTNIITRARAYKDKTNAYYINGIPSENFGRNVPDEVIEITNLDKTVCDIVYGSQHNPPFMLMGISGTERARQLVGFSDVLTIDKAIKLAIVRKKNIIKHIDQVRIGTELVEEELRSLGNVEELKIALNTSLKFEKQLYWLEKCHRQVDLYELEKTNLLDIDITLFKVKDKVFIVQRIYNTIKSLYEIAKIHKHIEHIYKRNVKISNCIDKLIYTKSLNKLIGSLKEISALRNNNFAINLDIEEYKKGIKELKSESKSIMKELGICPFCGRKI